MFRLNWKCLLIVVVVAATLVASTSQADAFWGWGCYRSCYWGCYSPCYTPCYSPCYTPCYSPCYTSCYWPCYTSCCYPSCSWDACCTGVVTSAAPAVAPATPTPAERPEAETPTTPPGGMTPVEPTDTTLPPLDGTPSPMPETPFDPATPLEPSPTAPTPDTSAVPTRENSGLLIVHVPYDAEVSINGIQTRSKGSRRQYVSYGLRPGFSYKYEVRAQVIRNDRPVEEVRTVVLQAGDREAVAFGFNVNLTEGLASR